MTSKRDTPIGDLHKAEITKLKRKVAELEKMLLPNQIRVYKAAMLFADAWDKSTWYTEKCVELREKMLRACKRARGGK